jgi:selenocysteine insertion sequence-binding protein 2
MTLSYADAMRKKAQQAPESDKSKQQEATSSGSSGSANPTGRATTTNNSQGSPGRTAWGKGSVRKTSQLPQQNGNANRQVSNPWGKQPDKNQASTTQPSRKKSPAPSMDNAPKENKTTSSWKTIASNPRPLPSVQPQRAREAPSSSKAANANKAKPSPVAKKLVQNESKVAAHPPSNQPKKSKKPKPKLASMSIGDMISAPKKLGVGKGAKKQMQSQPPQESKNLEVDSSKEFPALGAASTQQKKPPKAAAWGAKAPNPAAAPPKVLKRGEALPAKHHKKASSKKESGKKEDPKSNSVPSTKMSAAMFFKPVGMENRIGDGDEHQLLRLMQDRNVYQKKGRQRVAPRKKKFTALKKKVLQERLKKWHELHPEEAPSDKQGVAKTSRDSLENRETCSICVYRYAYKDDMEDDDEYDEIVENLRGLASKIGEVEEIFIPRDLDRPENYPAFVKFKTPSDASAAKACWGGLVIGGESLEVVPIDESTAGDETSTQKWSEKVLAAESMRKDHDVSTDKETAGPTAIMLNKVLTDDDYEDEDCMNESLDDLRRIAEQYGKVLDLRASDAKDGNVEIIYEADSGSARNIVDNLRTAMVSGEPLSVSIPEKSECTPGSTSPSIVILENVLTEDDLEDEDCLNETLNDIHELTGRHGEVSDITVEGSAVKVTYVGGLSVAQIAVNELNGLCLGGMTVTARVANNENEERSYVYLKNLLTGDDLEDEDCLEESLNDVQKLAAKVGEVLHVDVVQKDGSGIVRVLYAGPQSVAEKSVTEFDGMVMGGQIVSATTKLSLEGSSSETSADAPVSPGDQQDSGPTSESTGEKRKPSGKDDAATLKKPRTDDPAPLYSGDKLIPERFAECKRVPKVPNTTGPREYAKLVNDERVRPLLVEMLGELMRLQKRAMEEKNAKAKRRIVMGLREVARGIRSHKVKMVVMANNLDQYGAIDEKLQEIIDLAYSEGVPLFFEFTKRSLGKAVGKSIKIAVAGIQNADGAHQPFKMLISLAAKM